MTQMFSNVMPNFWQVLLLIWEFSGSSHATLSGVIETTLGPVRGFSGISRHGNTFYNFLGIPYAKPPIGNLRFEAPVLPERWNFTFHAITKKQPCLQFEQLFSGRIQGVEDCLYFNVYSPNVPGTSTYSGNPLPVMVFIHGGGFTSGDPGIYGPNYLMDANVVLVSMAYRVASFGFLSTGDGVIRGNMGLWDQNVVLKWVQDNIRNFGGDPQRVTLFGESSGASAVHWHILSPASKGLFHRAISQTGSAFRRYPNTEDYKAQAKNLASRVGCTTAAVEAMVNCLKRVDAMRIVQTHRDIQNSLRGRFTVYGPTVEAVKDDKAFITKDVIEILQSGNFPKIPWITGVNSADGILSALRLIKERGARRRLEPIDGWISHLPTLLRFDDDNLGKASEAALKIRNFYFGDKISPFDSRAFNQLINMFSDRLYYLPNYNAVKLQSVHSPVYLYYFDYQTEPSTYKLANAINRNLNAIAQQLQVAAYFFQSWVGENFLGQSRPYEGAAHADELFLLFNLNPIIEARPGSRDYKASINLVNLWTDYATSNDSVKFDGKEWPYITPEMPHLKYLRIGAAGNEVINDPFEGRMLFWKSLNLTFLGHPL